MESQYSNKPSEIEEVAAFWVIKTTQKNLTSQEEHEFQQWVTTSEQHRNAYFKARQLWGLTSGIALSVQKGSSRKTGNIKFAPRWIAMASALILSVFSFAIWSFLSQESVDYQAKNGEILHIILPDGSQVDLDSGAAITLEFNEGYRQVNLHSGRAYFSAAPISTQEPRPFRVKANNGTVQALGTEFEIDTQEKQVNVAVYEHQVQITLLSGETQRVIAGDQASYQQHISPMVPANIQHGVSWRKGLIIFQQSSVDHVIHELSRYREKPIILLGNPPQAMISGVFQIDSVENALLTVTSSKGLSVSELPFFTLVYWY
nr:FecR domain-containing protein [Providencia rustigianii]